MLWHDAPANTWLQITTPWFTESRPPRSENGAVTAYIERAFLGPRHPKHTKIKHGRLELTARELVLRDMSREAQAVQMRQSAGLRCCGKSATLKVDVAATNLARAQGTPR